jgi:hypothetical protein
MKVQIGEIVHLNSGSPDLKVINVNGPEACVEWENEKGKMQQHTFSLASLTPQPVLQGSKRDL